MKKDATKYDVTEYDGYIVEAPYIGKDLSESEKAELENKRNELKKEFWKKWANK